MGSPLLPLSLAFVMSAQTNQPAADLSQLNTQIAEFAPTPLQLDTSHLTAGDRNALVKLIEAGRVIDDIFLQQFWTGNEALYRQLQADHSPLGQARRHLFWISKGPWSTLDGQRAFVPDVPERKPLGANFYPVNMTREDFEQWIATLPASEADLARSFFTVIRPSSGSSRYTVVPYYREYQRDLDRLSHLLRGAAASTTNASLKHFLEIRAAAFLTDDYFESDVAWMDMDASIDVTIGPYETYNDELFGYKASFEAYICLTDQAETQKVKQFSAHLQQVEDHLPIQPAYRNPTLASTTPIRVVNELLAAGDGNHGVQTAAFNLPNDERVIQQKGSKKVMLKNIQHAKFDNTLIPISKLVLPPASQKDLSFDSFFTHILAHELSHGIGPHEIVVNGRKSSVRLELKDLYSAIEEAKADVTGLYMLQFFFDRNILPGGEQNERQLYNTFLASAFRTLRFGVQEAHGRGMALQFNYFTDHGAFVQRPDGTFEIDFSKVKPAVRQLTHELLTMEAQGDYQAAHRMIDQLGVIRPAMKVALNKLSAVPVDIEPDFVTANELAPLSH
jgi:Peptidase family M49